MPLDTPAPTRPATRRDRWGRYLVQPPDGGKEIGYTRVTTVAKALDDGGGLIPWKATATIVGAHRRPGLNARWAALIAEHADPWYSTPDSKAECKRLVEECATAGGSSDRADLGTALHSLAERVDLGQPLDHVPDTLRADLDAYRATMTANGIVIDPTLIEVTVVLDELRIAGTADRLLCTLPDGRRVVGDLKTGTSLNHSWQAIAVQLAAYANADAIYRQLEQGGERFPMPDLDRSVGLVIHLPAGEARCDLHLVDLDAGREALERAVWVRKWRSRRDLSSPFTVPSQPPLATVDGAAVGDVEQSGCDAAPGTVPSPTAGAHARRCAELAAQAAALDADQQTIVRAGWRAEWGTLRDPSTVPATALDAIAALIDPFTLDNLPTVRRDVVPLVQTVTVPAEGGPVTADDVAAIGERLRALSAQDSTWVRWLADEAEHAGCGFRLADGGTYRRRDIYLGLLSLAEAGYADGDCLRGVLALMMDNEEAYASSLPVGALVGTLDAAEAARFAGCAALAAMSAPFPPDELGRIMWQIPAN